MKNSQFNFLQQPSKQEGQIDDHISMNSSNQFENRMSRDLLKSGGGAGYLNIQSNYSDKYDQDENLSGANFHEQQKLKFRSVMSHENMLTEPNIQSGKGSMFGPMSVKSQALSFRFLKSILDNNPHGNTNHQKMKSQSQRRNIQTNQSARMNPLQTKVSVLTQGTMKNLKCVSSVSGKTLQQNQIQNFSQNPQTAKDQIQQILESLKFLTNQLSVLMASAFTNINTQQEYDELNIIRQFQENFNSTYKNSKNILISLSDKILADELRIKNLEEQVHKLIYGTEQKEKEKQKESQMNKKTLSEYEDLKTLKSNYNTMKREYTLYKQQMTTKERQISNELQLLEIKLKHKQEEQEHLKEEFLKLQELAEQKDMKLALQSVAQWGEEELKRRERLIMQLQQDKGDLRDVILQRDKEIQKLSQVMLEKDEQVKIMQTKVELEAHTRDEIYKQNIDIADKLKRVKDKFKKKVEEMNQMKIMYHKKKELVQKLEKELKKGYSHGVIVQYEDMNIEELLKTSNLFRGPQNIYSINNTTKLSMNYRNNLLSMMNTNVEKSILQKWQEESKTDISNLGDKNDNPSGGNSGYFNINQIEEVNLEQVSLHMHNLARPTFFNFIEAELQKKRVEQEREQRREMMNLGNTQQNGDDNLSPTRNISRISGDRSIMSMHYEKIRFEPPHKMWLFATMRAIYDSKYNEHKLQQMMDPRGLYNIQRFPDSFEKDKVDSLRLQLLVGLQTMKPSKMWECNLFVEFMEERFMNDDLHFFLHCRNLLYNGAQLKDIEAAQEAIYLIDQRQVNQVIDTLFFTLTPLELQNIKERFDRIAKERSKDITLPLDYSGTLPIDSSIVLRVLLEYYRNEKKAKSYIIKRLFKEQNSFTSQSVTFTQFKTVIDQIQPDISASDISQLYRNSWVLGNGKVNFDSFFLAANETNFFVKCIQLRGTSTPPILDPNNELQLDPLSLSQDELELQKQYSHVHTLWQQIEKPLSKIKMQIEQLGLEDLYKEFSFLETVIQQKAQYDSGVLNGRNMLQVFRQLMNKVLFIRSLYLEIEEREPMLQKSYKDIQNEFSSDFYIPYMEVIEKELNSLNDLRSEEAQKARIKERSGNNWAKAKELIQKKYTMIFKINKFK